MARRTYHVFDNDEENKEPVVNLRPGGWHQHPLTKKVKVAASTVGAVVALWGYLAGAGAAAIKWMGLATAADLAAQATAAETKRQSDIEADSKKATADEAKLNGKFTELKSMLDEIRNEIRWKKGIRK